MDEFWRCHLLPGERALLPHEPKGWFFEQVYPSWGFVGAHRWCPSSWKSCRNLSLLNGSPV